MHPLPASGEARQSVEASTLAQEEAVVVKVRTDLKAGSLVNVNGNKVHVHVKL